MAPGGDAVADSDRPLRVLIGPTNVADQGPALAEALRALGVNAYSLVRWPHGSFPAADWQGRSRTPATTLAAYDRFLRMARTADIVHLQSEGLLPPLPFGMPSGIEEAYLQLATRLIRALRRHGVVVAVTFHGSEIRPVEDIRAHWHDAERVLGDSRMPIESRERLLRYSDSLAAQADLVFVTTPDLLTSVPRSSLTPVVPSRPFHAELQSMGGQLPVPPSVGHPLRVLHAPSDPVIKGSSAIAHAVARARDTGADIEYRVLSGVPVTEVAREIRAADIVVDQVNFGWYGVFAAEAMALGRPAIARLETRNLQSFSSATGIGADALGILNADSDTLADVLTGLAAAEAATRRRLQLAALETYELLHRPEAAAGLALQCYLTARGSRGSASSDPVLRRQ